MTTARILIVEDERVVAEDIRDTLDKLGYSVLAIVSSGEEAIKEAEELRPDLVLVDIVLRGEVDGIEAAEQIRTRFNIPVVYLTAYSDDKTLERAKITNPFGYILKPLQERELFCAIEVALEKHRMEGKLKESEAHFRSLIENASDIVTVVSGNGIILYESPSIERVLGYKPEDLVGRDVFEFLHPDDVANVIEMFAGVVEKRGITVATEFRFRHKDGSWRILESVSRSQLDNAVIAEIVVNSRDITERKRMELERRELEQKARVASRLATVGEMASGIAHEVNNPLTTVIGFAQLLMGKDIPEDIREDVRIIHDSAQRVAGIVRRMLTFARQQKPERRYININEIIEATLDLRAYGMETSNIKITTQLDSDLPETMADASQLQQVFLNIIINAETEMKLAHDKGNFFVKTETIDDIIRVSFRDDGPGIAKENLGRVFDPFFTTREVGQGTGLGLSICHGIIAEHGGRVYAESQLGKGATFIVELPLATEDKGLELAKPSADEARETTRARILVVDDEPAILQFLDRLLTKEGWEVETVSNGSDALEKIKSQGYSLILMDVKLPGMSGIELYKHIREIAQSLASRVVFITGDVVAADTKAFLSKVKAPYIAKPFDSEQLKKDINRMLIGGT